MGQLAPPLVDLLDLVNSAVYQQALPLSQVQVWPGHNPRRDASAFSAEALSGLTVSVKEKGVLQPIWVRRIEGGYVIIAGERRYHAARLAGLTSIPALLFAQVTDAQALELAVIENAQRENLSLVDETLAGFELMKALTGLDQAALIQYLGRVRKGRQVDTLGLGELLKTTYGSDVSVWSQQRSKILAFTPDELEAVQAGRLSAKAVYPLLKLSDEARKKTLMQALEGGWTHQQVSAAVAAHLTPTLPAPSSAERWKRALPRLKTLSGAQAQRAEALLSELERLLEEGQTPPERP